MKNTKTLLFLFLLSISTFAQKIPLPEHPRPDFERSQWQNLNGLWDFEYDSLNTGEKNHWQAGVTDFSHQINVPFPWGSKLSGVEDLADIAWYKKEINVPNDWQDQRTFITIGASDWETSVWLNGHFLGKHQGGYTPFSFELTEYLRYGQPQNLVIKVDDARRLFTLYGKQGYGNARGIWQTPYLEARGQNFIESLHFEPNIDKSQVTAKLILNKVASANESLNLDFTNASQSFSAVFPAGQKSAEFTIDVENQHLWTLDDPFLYEVKANFADDELKTYFGMRKISVTNLPGTDIPYISLNNEPVYLQLALDQSYHSDGFYTFPTDEFMKNEILLAKNIGLNGIRTHIKVDIPRKLYWADKLGLFVMADLPNSWGEPDQNAQKESEYTLRQMIDRDFNHPSIFSWITFNETWGLRTKVTNEQGQSENRYLPETQYWVASMYYLAKSLDQTRLVEDNSICCGAGHTETDIYSWHQYLPGYEWEAFMSNLDTTTYAGSTYDFEKGFTQGRQPMINSECGNVWGYDGSTGDVDWSYDYHRMMNVFRQHPLMAGWLYTEHHDVINEWNGYWRFDRSPKYTGLEDLANGMMDRDFHSMVYLTTGQDITQKVKAGSTYQVPMYLSCQTGEAMPGGQLVIEYKWSGVDEIGISFGSESKNLSVDYQPWMQKRLDPLAVQVPSKNGIYQLELAVKKQNGEELHHNFMSFVVEGGSMENVQLVTTSPSAYTSASWSKKEETILNGKKANGMGKGSFTYELKTSDEKIKAKTGYLLLELSSRPLYQRDQESGNLKDMDYMLGAVADPARNSNAYPMTDTDLNPSDVVIRINGQLAKRMTLSDDPADHRGVLSWFNQEENRKLQEAGTYGYLVKIPLTKAQIRSLQKTGKMEVKLETNSENGLAVYGKDFGRYAFDPGVVLVK
ncbi:glycoside hydrolase family 2 protein [Jiulongibacter sediminis]|jgi:hypothetical protein|uniref:glycoside hydrolase family 2 protein n=1 Tax=Jiulongibacter sediminis TaxID=1605367 RepID=UPI0026EBF4F6|nr:sugar-binding domain-containing protein [Jiulongibacter sediminis]